MADLHKLEKKLGCEFADISLLETALTHSSYANENRAAGAVCNERLEFLGDSVLGMTVAAYLYGRHPDMPEGSMTRLRAELVCEQSLISVARELGLGEYLRLGRGEELSGGRTRQSILADAVEAVIAAVYLDCGGKSAERLIKTYILDRAESGNAAFTDYKTNLQELVQRRSGSVLTYRLTGESGPDHDKVFTASVLLNGEVIGMGSGRSKKEAEQDAARAALEDIGE